MNNKVGSKKRFNAIYERVKKRLELYKETIIAFDLKSTTSYPSTLELIVGLAQTPEYLSDAIDQIEKLESQILKKIDEILIQQYGEHKEVTRQEYDSLLKAAKKNLVSLNDTYCPNIEVLKSQYEINHTLAELLEKNKINFQLIFPVVMRINNRTIQLLEKFQKETKAEIEGFQAYKKLIKNLEKGLSFKTRWFLQFNENYYQKVDDKISLITLHANDQTTPFYQTFKTIIDEHENDLYLKNLLLYELLQKINQHTSSYLNKG